MRRVSSINTRRDAALQTSLISAPRSTTDISIVRRFLDFFFSSFSLFAFIVNQHSFFSSLPAFNQLAKQNTRRDQNNKHFDRSNKQSTMSRTYSATFSNLPVEIIRRIFDNLDGTTVLLSVRNVCQQLRATVDTYHRYELDLTALSKPDFSRILVHVHPQHVIGLKLNDLGTTPGQISVFRSLIDIGLFTQLRSLTLLEIEGQDLCLFLEHARRCSLISLTFGLKSRAVEEQPRIVEQLSSIIAQPTFFRLQLPSRGLYELIGQLEWPIQCKLQYLRMASYTIEQLSETLRRASDLRTLDLGTKWESIFNSWNDPAENSLTPHSRLTSLVIRCRLASLETILSFLSFQPALRHLKIINTEFDWPQESHLEELLKTKLPALDKFEFLAPSIRRRNRGVKAASADFSIPHVILDGGKTMGGQMQLVSHYSHIRNLHIALHTSQWSKYEDSLEFHRWRSTVSDIEGRSSVTHRSFQTKTR